MSFRTEPNVFIQYKGTDLCADLQCDCGEHLHVDSFNAYTIRCWNCKALWLMPQQVVAVKVDSTEYPVLETEKDDD